MSSIEDRIAVRYMVKLAMEHGSPAALKKYLRDHPDADPKNHSVSKGKGPSSGGKADQSVSSASKKSQAADKSYSDMESLRSKVDNANPAAKKRFDSAYDKIGDSGVSIKKDADKLLKSLESSSSKDAGDVVKLITTELRTLNNMLQDHARSSSEMAGKKLKQAEQTKAQIGALNEKIQMAKGL